MTTVSIFCKSYKKDLGRAIELMQSIEQFNSDSLPIYFSVPRDDLKLFRDNLSTKVNLITDEDIIFSNPDIDINKYTSLPGQLSQQIVKAEFWRLNPVENYVCVDSDMRFIQNFYSSDFLRADGQPFTVLHEGKEFLEFCLSNNFEDVLIGFEHTAAVFKKEFGRIGPSYNFGPFPVIWNARVWDILAHMLKNKGSNILDAIVAHPHEASWYGETLLKYRPIEITPKDPIFKAYLFLEEYEKDLRAKINEKSLARLYIGVVYQSNWYPKRLNPLSMWGYKIKRILRKHQ